MFLGFQGILVVSWDSWHCGGGLGFRAMWWCPGIQSNVVESWDSEQCGGVLGLCARSGSRGIQSEAVESWDAVLLGEGPDQVVMLGPLASQIYLVCAFYMYDAAVRDRVAALTTWIDGMNCA